MHELLPEYSHLDPSPRTWSRKIQSSDFNEEKAGSSAGFATTDIDSKDS